MVWIGRIVKGRYQALDITTFVDGLTFLVGVAIRTQVNGFPADGTVVDLGRGVHLNTPSCLAGQTEMVRPVVNDNKEIMTHNAQWSVRYRILIVL
jgi:hypothetical protein